MTQAGRTSIPTLPAIEGKCASVSRRLEGASDDEITLLRMARTLKGVNRDLLRIVQRAASAGCGIETGEAGAILGAMERNLRAVLLDDDGLKEPQIHQHLSRAVSSAFDVLALFGAEGETGERGAYSGG